LSPRARSAYLDRPSSRRSSYYSSGNRGGGGLRRVVYALLVVAALVAVAAVVQLTRGLPPQRVARSLGTTVAVSGQPPQLPWPSVGQAAVAIEGLGPVGSSGASTPVPIASLAKMMTAYQILTDHPLDLHATGPTLTVSAAAVADYRARVRAEESVLAVRAGERLNEYQALQALLIPSANNIAALLARWDAGSAPAFIARMNASAQRLGLTHTHYTDPAGQLSTTVSTAVDQLTLAQAAMKLPVFAAVVAQPAATFPIAGTVFNYNYNIGHDGFVGIKTGSNAAAGGCWAFAAQRVVAGKPTRVFGVVLGQRGKSGELIQPALDLGRRLADAVPRTVQQVTVVATGTAVGSVTAPWRDPVPVVTQKPVTVLAAPGQQLRAELTLNPPTARNLHAGAVVGTLVLGGVTTPVVLARDAAGPALGWRLTRI
jgi:serine-type D-Ala-D-Ala carboxypeptidase (penicillin-binding protein 5/6)